MTTEVAKRSAAVVTDVDQIQVIRNIFAKGASDDELAVFLRLAEKYDLDPLAREIWCICELDDAGERKLDKNGNPKTPLIQASRAGWRKVAQRDESCAGIEAGAVYSKDTFTRMPGGSVSHQMCLDVDEKGKSDRGKLVGAYGLVWRKGWVRPAYAWAAWAEYGEKQARDAQGKVRTWSPWAKYPSAMIEKQAESMALRQAFPLGAIASGDDRDVEALAAGDQPVEIEDRRPDGGHGPVATPVAAIGTPNAPIAGHPDGELFPPTQEELDAEVGTDYEDPA